MENIKIIFDIIEHFDSNKKGYIDRRYDNINLIKGINFVVLEVATQFNIEYKFFKYRKLPVLNRNLISRKIGIFPSIVKNENNNIFLVDNYGSTFDIDLSTVSEEDLFQLSTILPSDYVELIQMSKYIQTKYYEVINLNQGNYLPSTEELLRAYPLD